MNRVSEICLIAPSESLAKRAQAIIAEYGGEIDVYVGAMETAANLAEELSAHGARVFISRKGTKALLETVVSQPVVGIDTTLEDYAKPLQLLRGKAKKIGFFTYKELPEDVELLCKLLDMDAKAYRFTGLADTEKCVQMALEDGVQIAIGGATTAGYAMQCGLEHLILESSEHSIISAIDTAKQILEVQKSEAKKQEELSIRLKRYELIFNYTHDAIIAIDKTGHIDVLNQVAEKIINAEEKKPFVGKSIDDVLESTRMMAVLHSGEAELDQLMNINGTLVSTNRIPIVVDGNIHGVVATFQDIKRLQDSEQKIRIKMHEKGLSAKYSFSDIVGSSPELNAVKDMARSYARSNYTILVQGETGTGKELFAQSIHQASLRSNAQFVAINCAALPKNLLEAELFGYVDGAFTGAVKGGKAGLFEIAHGGTIFLDEIGELAVETQVQLLRVLQEKEIRRIGGDCVIPVDIRVITATNRDLELAVAEKRFREDLLYRLNALNIYIPPLRERRQDIEEVGLHLFLHLFGSEGAERQEEFLRILRQLGDYPWPGNVRELRNFVERVSVLMHENATPLQFSALVLEFFRRRDRSALITESSTPPDLQAWERERILTALKANNLSMLHTAEALGISRTTLWRKLRDLNIQI